MSRSSLPVYLTSFVGRERELNQLREFLQDVRLLTRVGVGGIGKTRLAAQLMRGLDSELAPDSVCFVGHVDRCLAFSDARGVRQLVSDDESVAE